MSTFRTMSTRRSQRAAAVRPTEAFTDTTESRISRPRGATLGNRSSMASLSRSSPSTPFQSMRLTVKTSSSKLREATRAESVSPIETRNVHLGARETFQEGEILEGKRPRHVKKSYVIESESESDEDEDEDMEAAGDEDAEGGEVDDDEEDDDDDEDAAGDVEMNPPPPPPTIKISKAKTGKLIISAKPSGKSDGKSVEQKESKDSDEELSELDSDEVEEEDGMQSEDEEDAAGEDEGLEEAAEDDEEEALDRDANGTTRDGSRLSASDLSRLTKRQRARLEEGGNSFLMALPDEPQVKKHLTAEEHAMRRAEMARRRKNLSEKRNEEEKMETINKLLKKQAPKTNARRKDLNAAANSAARGDSKISGGLNEKPDARFTKWVSNKEGCRIGVPGEWLDGGVGGWMGANVAGKEIAQVL